MEANEYWKSIVEGPRNIEVSTLGRIRDKITGNIVKPQITNRGYNTIYVGNYKRCLLHRLIAFAFIPNPLNLPQVNHINGVKTDNRVENLEWCTSSHNIQYAFDNGLQVYSYKSAKLTAQDVMDIRTKHKHLKTIKIMKMYNMERRAIYNIRKNITWKHVIPPSTSKTLELVEI